MRELLAVAALAVTTTVSAAALPCGMPYSSDELKVDPTQKILVGYDGTTETYVFSPHFCGRATDFGLIFPVPQPLSESPALATSALLDDVDTLTAPTVEEQVVCIEESSQGGCLGAGDDGALGSGRTQNGSGVDVIDAGKVGAFDWVLLAADSTAAFTDWLDQNGYPYDQGDVSRFDEYVQMAWQFVAFRFTTASGPPPSGSRLCGDLGPLQLRFPASQVVIPARITAGNSEEQIWDITTIAPSQLHNVTSGAAEELRFAATPSSAELGAQPDLAAFGAAGMRVTTLRLTFHGADLSGDIVLEPDPAGGADFRAVETHTVRQRCDGGCTVTLGRRRVQLPDASLLLWAFGLWLGCRHGRRQRR